MPSIYVADDDMATLEHVLQHCPLPSYAPPEWRERLLRAWARPQQPQVWVVTSRDCDTNWSFDGPHGPESDLGPTLAILKRLGDFDYFKLTVAPPNHHGVFHPRMESLRQAARGAGVAPPLPHMPVAKRAPAADGSDCAYGVPGYSCVGSTDIRDTPCARCDA